MTPQNQAISFLSGLKADIKESGSGKIEIESTDLEQIENCIGLIGIIDTAINELADREGCPADTDFFMHNSDCDTCGGHPDLKTCWFKYLNHQQ